MEILGKHFGKIGARLKFRPGEGNDLRINVLRDKNGEYFDILAGPDIELQVVDAQPEDRHLLLLAKQPGEGKHAPAQKDRFLCGHDERHWFVAGVPGVSVSSVRNAKDALKPAAVVAELNRRGVKQKKRDKRRNEAFVRQGEWFFIPVPDMVVDQKLVLKNEPLSRGRGSKPHSCQFLYREGGTQVHVCGKYPNGLTDAHYANLIHKNPEAKKYNWTIMRRDPSAYVKGAISHSDHATINLVTWHRVVMNRENESRSGRNITFLD
jgi:hypothetical protein